MNKNLNVHNYVILITYNYAMKVYNLIFIKSHKKLRNFSKTSSKNNSKYLFLKKFENT